MLLDECWTLIYSGRRTQVSWGIRRMLTFTWQWPRNKFNYYYWKDLKCCWTSNKNIKNSITEIANMHRNKSWCRACIFQLSVWKVSFQIGTTTLFKTLKLNICYSDLIIGDFFLKHFHWHYYLWYTHLMLITTQKCIVNLPLLSLSGRQLNKAWVHWRKKRKSNYLLTTAAFVALNI